MYLTEPAVRVALGEFFRMHPKVSRLAVSVRGEEVVVTPFEAFLEEMWPVAPEGYFNQFYTPELAAEENRLAVALPKFAPADLPE